MQAIPWKTKGIISSVFHYWKSSILNDGFIESHSPFHITFRSFKLHCFVYRLVSRNNKKQVLQVFPSTVMHIIFDKIIGKLSTTFTLLICLHGFIIIHPHHSFSSHITHYENELYKKNLRTMTYNTRTGT